jgi:hypothetical protein
MFDSCRCPHRFPLAAAAMPLVLALCVRRASAQPSTEWQLNAPYRCPDGRSYTITKRAGTGPHEACWYTFERGGVPRADRDGIIFDDAYRQDGHMSAGDSIRDLYAWRSKTSARIERTPDH